jgi:hypothetical protein
VAFFEKATPKTPSFAFSKIATPKTTFSKKATPKTTSFAFSKNMRKWLLKFAKSGLNNEHIH